MLLRLNVFLLSPIWRFKRDASFTFVLSSVTLSAKGLYLLGKRYGEEFLRGRMFGQAGIAFFLFFKLPAMIREG